MAERNVHPNIVIAVDYPPVGNEINGVTYASPEGWDYEHMEAFLLALDWAADDTDAGHLNVQLYASLIMDASPGRRNSYQRMMPVVLHPPESTTMRDVMDLLERAGCKRTDNNQEV